MNILIKLTCLIGLVIAPILGSGHEGSAMASCCSKQGTQMMCKSMSHEECVKMGCTNMNCEKKHAAEQMMGQPSTESSKEEVTKEVVMEDLPDGRVKATYTVSKHTVEDVKTFEGTKDEVSAQINALK